MKRLKNKVVVVTGAASGLGKEIAILFASEGAKIVAADLNEQYLAELQDTVKNSEGNILTVKTDITNQDEVNNLFQKALQNFGTVDILINNAGVLDNFAPVGDVDDETWNKVMNVNINAAMRTSRAALQIMLKNGNGSIVNISSIGGLHGFRAGVAYTTSKHALIGLTKNTAYAYAPLGIRCNAIAPGSMKTPMASNFNPQTANHLGTSRMWPAMEGTMKGINAAEPVQVARVALFLASDEADYVNGAVITADGGWTAF